MNWGRWLALPIFVIVLILSILASAAVDSPLARPQNQQQEEAQQEEQQRESSSGQATGKTRVRITPGGTSEIPEISIVTLPTRDGWVAVAANGAWPSRRDLNIWEFDQETSTSFAGFRFGEEGLIEPVHQGALAKGDIGVQFLDDVVYLHELGNPDGHVRLTVEFSDLTIEFLNDSQILRTELSPDYETFEVGEQFQVRAERVGNIVGAREGDTPNPFNLAPLIGWIALGVALTMLVVGFWLLFSDGLGLLTLTVDQRELDLTVEAPATLTMDQQQMDLFAALRNDPDANRVVRYLFELASSGQWGLAARPANQTAYEYQQTCATILRGEGLRALNELANRYTLARFSPSTLSIDDRDAAIDAAQDLYTYLCDYALPEQAVGEKVVGWQ